MNGSGLPASIFSTAMSVRGSVPNTLAFSSVPSSSVTLDRLLVLDDVVIGHDQPVLADDEAGAARLLDAAAMPCGTI